MPVQVIFTHDDDKMSWEAKVIGAEDHNEARQAFNAVVLTCQQLNPNLLNQTKVIPHVEGDFEIVPAV